MFTNCIVVRLSQDESESVSQWVKKATPYYIFIFGHADSTGAAGKWPARYTWHNRGKSIILPRLQFEFSHFFSALKRWKFQRKCFCGRGYLPRSPLGEPPQTPSHLGTKTLPHPTPPQRLRRVNSQRFWRLDSRRFDSLPRYLLLKVYA